MKEKASNIKRNNSPVIPKNSNFQGTSRYLNIPKKLRIILGIAIISVLIFFGITFFYFSSGQTKIAPVTKTAQHTQKLIGGNRDSHGCLTSEGYSWCALKNKCLRTQAESCSISPTIEQAIKPTISPTPEAQTDNNVAQNPAVSGGPGGQITCTNQIPPDPDNYGEAIIQSSWNNLILGKNGTAKAAVCVSVGGRSSLMSLDNTANGSRTTDINWIILNASYSFTLYDDHGGDLPDCGGAVLSSCEVYTVIPPTPESKRK